MENSGVKEKRAFTRFSVRILLRYLNLNLNGEMKARTQDISAKGICLATNEPLAIETPLDIWLQMPDTGEEIYARGRVVWSNMIEHNKYRAGVSLENIQLNPIIVALKAIQARIKHY